MLLLVVVRQLVVTPHDDEGDMQASAGEAGGRVLESVDQPWRKLMYIQDRGPGLER